jgi:hypothetical protein
MPKRALSTPWITAVNPAEQVKYKFRLSTLRRGGAINVEFHKDCTAAPGLVRIIPRSRPGYYEFIKASLELIDSSMWDPTTKPGLMLSRCIWREFSAHYAMRAHNAEIVTAYLPRIVTPRRGRTSLAASVDASQRAIAEQGTNVSHITARAHRKAEVRIAASKVMTALAALRERCTDARKMKGFTAAEVQELARAVEATHAAADHMLRIALANAGRPAAPAPIIGVPLTSTPADRREAFMNLDMEQGGGVPLSEGEQALMPVDDEEFQ